MDEIVHDQHAIKTVKQECAGPIPPTALKSPEVTERRATSGKTALNGEAAVELGGAWDMGCSETGRG